MLLAENKIKNKMIHIWKVPYNIHAYVQVCVNANNIIMYGKKIPLVSVYVTTSLLHNKSTSTYTVLVYKCAFTIHTYVHT